MTRTPVDLAAKRAALSHWFGLSRAPVEILVG